MRNKLPKNDDIKKDEDPDDIDIEEEIRKHNESMNDIKVTLKLIKDSLLAEIKSLKVRIEVMERYINTKV